MLKQFLNGKEPEKKTAEQEKRAENVEDTVEPKLLEDTITKDPIKQKKDTEIKQETGAEVEIADKPLTKTEENKRKPSASINNLTFRVQIIASKEQIPLNSQHFKGEKNLNELLIDGYYKYMTDPVSTYSESQKIRKNLSAKFLGAFIVAFLDGEKISLKEALKIGK